MATKVPLRLMRGNTPGAFVGRDPNGQTTELTGFDIAAATQLLIPTLTFVNGTTLEISAGRRFAVDYSAEVIFGGLTKTIAPWVQGDNNGILGDPLVANTWWYVFLITDGVGADVVMSTSRWAPSLPVGWSVINYLGAVKINAASEITAFWQQNDKFFWNTQKIDYSFSGTAGPDILFDLDLPNEIPLLANVSISTNRTGALNYDLIAVLPGSQAVRAGSNLGFAVHFSGKAKTLVTRIPLNMETECKVVVGGSYSGLQVHAVCLGWEDPGVIS